MEHLHDDLDFTRALQDYSNEFYGITLLAGNQKISEEKLLQELDHLTQSTGGVLVRRFETVFPKDKYPEVYEGVSETSLCLLDIIVEEIQNMYRMRKLDRVKLLILCRKAKSITHPGSVVF